MSAAPEIVAWNGHEGRLLGRAAGYDVIACASCGFAHATPLPTPADLAREYAENYYADAKPTYLQDASRDQDWARLFQDDRLDAIARHAAPPGALLEIGSGPGFFLDAAAARGWSVVGVEPSRQAAAFAAGRGHDVRNQTFAEALAAGLPQADALAATNVLEHLPDPIETLRLAHAALKPGGALCITAPNDFNPLQRAAQGAKGHAPWWIAPPHHLNYFDFESLEALLVRLGFQPVERLTSFPMEAFLLMGEDYVRAPETGRACHERRMSFDLSFAEAGLNDARRRFYAALAAAGMGREATVIAVRP